jgi:DNA polymerase-4
MPAPVERLPRPPYAHAAPRDPLQPAQPVFLHLDLDQFFVSVERLRDPSLRGRPVVVGGADPSARGAVACASYEARAHGVHSGMALRRAWGLCREAVFLSGSPQRYMELSRQVRDLLEARAPRVIQRSIDEFDVDLTGCERLLGDPGDVALGLRAAIDQRTGLDCSLGLAGTPLVAKVAAGQEKPRGFVRVPAGAERVFLAPLPARKLPGVGPRTEERLRELGITTVGELAELPLSVLGQALGAHGRLLGARARGGRPRLEASQQVTPFFGGGHRAEALGATPSGKDRLRTTGQEGSRAPKSVSRARTFPTDQDARAVLDAALVRLVEEATASLRAHRLRARSVAVAVRYADLVTTRRSARLPPDAQERAILARARGLLDRLLTRRLRVRRLGVAFHDLRLAHHQLLLFEGPNARDQRALGVALDAIRGRHGWDAVRMGSGEG